MPFLLLLHLLLMNYETNLPRHKFLFRCVLFFPLSFPFFFLLIFFNYYFFRLHTYFRLGLISFFIIILFGHRHVHKHLKTRFKYSTKKTFYLKSSKSEQGSKARVNDGFFFLSHSITFPITCFLWYTFWRLFVSPFFISFVFPQKESSRSSYFFLFSYVAT